MTEAKPTKSLLGRIKLERLCIEIARQTHLMIPFSANMKNDGTLVEKVNSTRALRLLALRARRSTTQIEAHSKTLSLKDMIEKDLDLELESDQPDGKGKTSLNQRCLELTDNQYHVDSLIELLSKFSNLIAFKSTHKDESQFTLLEKIESGAKNAKRFGIGNCSENSFLNIVAALECPEGIISTIAEDLELPKGIPIELFSLIGGDEDMHSFVVVNRNPDSSIEDMHAWGKDAMIIDTWFGQHGVYFVTEFLEKTKSRMSQSDESMEQGKNQAIQYMLRRKLREDEFIKEGPSLYFGQGHSERWNAKHSGELLFEFKHLIQETKVEPAAPTFPRQLM